ncbi:MAG: alkaline phosphatase family protein [Alphaproteobacteria bacterium]|nr:alkaline phosphatase family protein [Alphaproteobacteria bacterium]
MLHLSKTSRFVAAALLSTSCLCGAAFASDLDLGRLSKPLKPQGPHPKVILISLDGAAPRFVDKYIEPGMKGIALLRSVGSHALQNVTATPSLTAVSHIAIATGSTAAHNDIPSNTFSAVAGTLSSSVSGFAAPIGGYQISPLGPTANPTSVPMWMALRDAGKKVVTATWPGGDGADIRINGTIVQNAVPTRTVDYTVPFGAFGGIGAQGFEMTGASFASDPTVQSQLATAGHPSYSPVETASVETIFCAPDASNSCGTTNASGRTLQYTMKAAALDSTNDGNTNYDTLVFYAVESGIHPGPFHHPNTGPAYTTVGHSAPFFFEGSGDVVGAAYFLTTLAPDLSSVRFVRYGANFIPRNTAVLDDVDDISDHVGFWAPQDDFRIPERLSPGFANFSDEELEQVYDDQVKTFINYQTRLALRSIDKNADADLVMLYFEEPDGSSHQFLLTDPRQATDPKNPNTIGAGQNKAKVHRYDNHVRLAYQTANDAVDAIIRKVGTAADGTPLSNVIVVSDHGFAPFHTAVSATNLLKAALVAKGFDAGLVNTAVSIKTSGPAANVYINLQGRESGGTVDTATYNQLVAAISDYFRTAVDPNPNFDYSLNHRHIFTQVFARPSGCGNPGFCTDANIGQDTGDVFAMMAEGYNFDGTQSPGVARKGDPAYDSATSVFSAPNFYGAHGHDPNGPNMSASFFAAGPNIRHNVAVRRMRNIDVAPTIETILGVKPAATVDGNALTQIVR